MKFSTTATVIAAALTVFSNPSEARFGGWNGAAAQGAAMIISGFDGGTLNGPTNGGYRPPPSNFNAPIVRPFRDEVEDDLYDDMDDDEDECSTRNFDRVLVATTEMTGVAPNPACARAVFDKICDECEDDIQCYLKLGRQVGPQTPQCQPRRLRQPKHRKLMPYWKGAGFTSLGDCQARGPVGNCRQTWRGYKWVSCGGLYCRKL